MTTRWNVAKTTWGEWMAFTYCGDYRYFPNWRSAFEYADFQSTASERMRRFTLELKANHGRPATPVTPERRAWLQYCARQGWLR